MVEHLSFGFDQSSQTPRLYVDVPTEIYDDVRSDTKTANDIARLSGQSTRALQVKPVDDETTRAYINAKRVGSLGPEFHDTVLTGVARVVNALEEAAGSERQDPLMHVILDAESEPCPRRLAVSAEVVLPLDLDDAQVSQVATSHMRGTASMLRYGSRRDGMGGVFAEVSRNNGVLLETHANGSCSLESDGGLDSSGQERLELSLSSLYDRKQQFICLAGIVAVAHAPELLSRQGLR